MAVCGAPRRYGGGRGSPVQTRQYSFHRLNGCDPETTTELDGPPDRRAWLKVYLLLAAAVRFMSGHLTWSTLAGFLGWHEILVP